MVQHDQRHDRDEHDDGADDEREEILRRSAQPKEGKQMAQGSTTGSNPSNSARVQNIRQPSSSRTSIRPRRIDTTTHAPQTGRSEPPWRISASFAPTRISGSRRKRHHA